MEMLSQNISGLIILMVLGLRHGLDPDHIAMIDSYTYRLHQTKSNWSRWVGTLFTFGHGLMVTLISLFLCLLKNQFEMPYYLELLIKWIPMIMLSYIGITNILMMTHKKPKTSFSIRQCLMPVHFKTKSNPFSIIVTGLIFGFIFDTSSQIAAFSYTISATNQWLFALIGGLVFSLGLIITGTCDSLLLNKLLQSFDQKKVSQFRFKINVLITLMCFAIPFYKIMTQIQPKLELTEIQNNFVGLAFIGLILALYLEIYLKYRHKLRTH